MTQSSYSIAVIWSEYELAKGKVLLSDDRERRKMLPLQVCAAVIEEKNTSQLMQRKKLRCCEEEACCARSAVSVMSTSHLLLTICMDARRSANSGFKSCGLARSGFFAPR